tara:strand:+ start:2669 stop:4495 length:1827 start_codon:yes stop_codon:yes gene_type:complete
METPHLMIRNYINSFENLDFMRESLLGHGIYSKSYPEDGLMIIYTKYEPIVGDKSLCSIVKKNLDNNEENIESGDLSKQISAEDVSRLKIECRSLIIDTEKKEIVSYSCNTPICNLEAINYLLNNKSSPKISNNIEKFKCYEGTLLSLFKHKNRWYLSTRRNLDSKDSIWNNVSYYDLFLDVIDNDNIKSLDEFVDNLDESYCYYFILIHHLNKNIVDYSTKFGNNYKKLCLAFVRKKNDLSEIDLTHIESEKSNIDNSLSISVNKILSLKNIFLAERIDQDADQGISSESISLGPESENKYKILDDPLEKMTSCDDEGVIIRIKNNNNISHFLKIQTYSYQFNKAIGAEKNIFKGFLNLYQNNQLVNYLECNSNLSPYKKIINPLNIQESYDTVGIIDSVFKVCTSELYELFKMLWDIKTGKQLDTEIYKILPKEYKTVLYNIRGIYYKKKYDNNKSNTSYDDFNTLKLKHSDSKSNLKLNTKDLQIKDIYQYLKKGLDTDKLEQYLRVRKLMYNWIKVDSENECLKKFSKINLKCDKVHLKLIAIFCNKLFPNIMPDDIPDPVNLSKSFGSLNSLCSLASLNNTSSFGSQSTINQNLSFDSVPSLN